MTDIAAAPVLTEEQKQARLARLQTLGSTLNTYWDEAVNARVSSGIERQWLEDEEHYEGIDDANRGAQSGTDSKPPGLLMIGVTGDDNDQCTEFVNITAPYVEFAASKVGDILQPTDERAWSITNTPIPELVEKAKGVMPVEVQEGMALLDVPDETKKLAVSAEIKAARALLEEAKKKAERAQTRISDWQIESQYAAAVREVIEDAAKSGTGILKGPVPQKKKQQMFKDGVLVIEETTKPISKRVDYWNIFPAPGCGQNPRKARYIYERDYLAPFQLEQLKGGEGYLDDQIELCLDEGPQKKSEPRKTTEGAVLDDKNTFEIRYFHGYATREDLEVAGWTDDPEAPAKLPKRFIPVIFEMVNGRVIKGALNPLDTGDYPYDFFRWKRKKNSPWGVGVARQIRTAQRIVTAAVRVMLTNAGRAAGPLIVLMDGVIGADGLDDIFPWKVYRVKKGSSVTDADKAVSLVEIPILTNELMVIVNFGLKIAEDTTGLPMLLQGQTGSAPDTYGGQALATRNGAGVLRRIARFFDDDLTEPSTNRYYTYLLLYGPEDVEKGEFVIDARGSTALVERELARQEATSLLQASLNPKFGLDPKKTMAEKLRADNRDPEAFQYTEEEWNAMQRNAGKQPPDPRIAATQIHEQAESARLDKKLAAEAKDADAQRQVELMLGNIEERVQEIKSQGAKEISFDEMKAMLAKAAMTLSEQRRAQAVDITHEKDVAIGGHKMAHFKHTVPQVATPLAEPPGRAPDGEGFER